MIAWHAGAWLAVAGCGGAVECREPGQVLAEQGGQTLTCGDARAVTGWIELLAGRELSSADRSLANGELVGEFRDDPAATRTLIETARVDGRALAALTGLEGAEARSARVFAADAGTGLVREEHDGLWNLQRRALSVWTKSGREGLALTESDLEAWIRYASLCREAQGAGVLRVSVGDRVPVYQTLIGRFDTGDRATMVALASFGPVWEDVKDRWQAASYERQQAWIAAAPLPPPMNATSMGYADALFQSELPPHARALHDVLGPFAVGDPAVFGEGGSP